MATLADLAKPVRSKNAGPFWLTIDIMFDDAQAYRRARDAEIVNRAAIARPLQPRPGRDHRRQPRYRAGDQGELSASAKLRLQARQRCLRRAAIRTAAGARGAFRKTCLSPGESVNQIAFVPLLSSALFETPPAAALRDKGRLIGHETTMQTFSALHHADNVVLYTVPSIVTLSSVNP